MFLSKLPILIFTFLVFFSQNALAQDIGILSEPVPAKKKPTEKVVPRKPLPPPRKAAEPAEKTKRRVILTIISDPLECEIYVNDIYRGTTASLNGKLIVPDLDPTVSYSIRIYKRGIGEELKTLALSQDQELKVSLKEKVANTATDKPNTSPDKPIANPDKNTPPEELVTNTLPTKQADKPIDKAPDKPIDKEPSNPINDTSVAATSNPVSNPSTTATTPTTKPVIMPPQREMVLINAGEVNIGSNSSIKADNFRPQHKVNVATFYIDVYEVNNADYKLFCDATSRTYPPNPEWDSNYFLTKPNYPVINVTWDDANAYAFWVGKRLPTEEEWEKAARGIESRNWPWGKDYQPNLTNLAGAEDGFEYTAPTGNFPEGVSPYGVQDMVGNVWEWTSSSYKPYPGGPDDKRYTLENEKYRVIRGGGYNVLAKGLRTAAFRFPGEFKKPYDGTGFRCAKSQ